MHAFFTQKQIQLPGSLGWRSPDSLSVGLGEIIEMSRDVSNQIIIVIIQRIIKAKVPKWEILNNRKRVGRVFSSF